jgi:hypothetical protein
VRLGFTPLSRSQCSSLIVTNDLVTFLHAWKSHALQLPTSQDCDGHHQLYFTRFSSCGMQWRGLEDRLLLLSRRSAESLRTPWRLAAAEGGTSVPTLSLDLQPPGFDQLYFNLLHPERVYCIVSREAVYSSCRASVTQPRCPSPPALSGHQLHHLVRPNACCRRLPISCPICLLEYPEGWFDQFKHEAKCLQRVHKNHQERNRGPIHRSYGNASAPVCRTQSLRTGQRPNRGLMRQAYRDSSPKAS